MINQNIKLNEKLEALNLQKDKIEEELNNVKIQISQVKEEIASIKRKEKQKEKDEASKRKKDYYAKKREELNITFEDMEIFNSYLLNHPSYRINPNKIVENKVDSIPDNMLITINSFIEDIKKDKMPKVPRRIDWWIFKDWKRK